VRRVKRRKGRRNLANFENLAVTTHIHELHGAERLCPCYGIERLEIGEEETWQIEYIPGCFERIRHVQKKYACLGCEKAGENPRMEMAAKPETAIDKGMAGPGRDYWHTSSAANFLITCRCIGWKTFLSGKDLRSRGNAVDLVWRCSGPGYAVV
jgi:hypothetical protein